MKHIYLILLFFAFTTNSQAQQDSTAKSSLTLAAVYSSTANYFGQTTAEKLPYVMTYASYKMKSGLYVSATALKLINNSAGIANVDLSAGYAFNISKKLEADLSYTRSFFRKDAPLLQASNENNVNSTFSLSHIFKTSLRGDYQFGKQQDAFVTVTNSKLITLGSFSDKDLISLEPAFSVIAGTQHFYVSYVEAEQRRLELLDQLFPVAEPAPKTTTVSSTKFDLLAYVLSIPLAYSRANYTVEATYTASLAGKRLAEASKKPVSIFNLSLYYQF
jgi:hypothetical protein